MGLWLDMLGTEISFVDTPTYGRIRVLQAGMKNSETVIFQHGINGHLEAYAKNIIPLSSNMHVIAFDYVGHGLSDKKLARYDPKLLADQLRELMDAMDIESAHLSGESLGGWVSGIFATTYPKRVRRLMLNTAAGIPIISAKGREDLATLLTLNERNVGQAPTYDGVKARMRWLMHPTNHHLLDDELIDLRLAIYNMPDTAVAAPLLNEILVSHDECLIPLEQLECDTLFLWTRDNPIHDTASAEAAAARTRNGSLYVMRGDAAHWPQYEEPDEFNAVALQYFLTGEVLGDA